MPNTFSFEEATKPASTFSFEEASKPSQSAPEIAEPGIAAVMDQTQRQMIAPNPNANTTDLLSAVVNDPAEPFRAAGRLLQPIARATETVLNIPGQVWDTAARMGIPIAKRNPSNEPLVDAQQIERAIPAAIETELGAPLPDSSALKGISESLSKTISGFTTPSMLLTLPAAELKPVQLLFGANMLSTSPQVIANTIDTIKDPDATNTQKWEAGGSALTHLAIAYAGLKGVPLKDVREAVSPERAAEELNPPPPSLTPKTEEALSQTVNAPELPKSEPQPTEIEPQPDSEQPLNPGGSEASLPPEQRAISQANNSREALAKASGSPLPTPEVDQPVKSQEMVGMGGAVPSEFEPSGSFTSNKNAAVDTQRAQRGLPPLMSAMRQSWGEAWTQAMAKIDQEPGYQDDLIRDLTNKPRAITDVENAALLHRNVDLRNEYDKATRDGALAYEDKRDWGIEEAKLRTAQWSDKLVELEKVLRSVGTESGRSLAARKMVANADFSLAQMELEKRAANNFEPLTDNQRIEIQQLHDQIQKTQSAFDEYQRTSQERISKLESDKAIAEQAVQASKEPKPVMNPKVLEIAKGILDKWDKAADEASQSLKDRLGRTSAGLDPSLLIDLAKIGRAHLGHAALNVAEFGAKLIEEFGDVVKPHIQEIYDASTKLIDEGDKSALDKAREMRSKSPDEQIKANSEKIGEKIKAGKKDEISFYVQRITRLLFQKGVTDREKLIDAVHAELKNHIPDITRRQAMDAISGYGEFKQLSKDQISIQLRGLKGEMQQIAKLEDMAAGKPPLKSGLERRTPTEAEQQLIKKVEESKFAFQVPMTDPSTQLKSALDTYKTTLRNRITDLEAKIAAGDYSKNPRRELQLDNEALRLKAQAEKAKQRFQQGLLNDRLKNRNWWQKTMDAVVKWRRGFILSGPVTLAKLTAAAVARAITTPVEEAIGAGVSKIIPSVAEKAPRHGGASIAAESKAITEGIMTGAKDAWQVLKTGKSDLDTVMNKKAVMPQSFIDIFGNIHGALKAPTKRAEFARSFQKRAEFYVRQGVDITDEFVQTKIAMEAYQDANRAIFMQENIINDAYKRALSRLDQLDKKTGKPSAAGAALGTTARVLLPIVKVPTNIVGEVMEYALGAVTGSARLGKAFRDGVDKLSPEDADLIMRQLKKGSLGGAVMLAGFLAPQYFGGFYQQGQKRDKKDIPPDSARVNGITIPPQYIHAPLVEAAQLGATVRRVADSKLHKKDKETQGLSHGALAGAFGLAESVPFLREMSETAKAFNANERDQWLGELGKSLIVPQVIQSIANAEDKDEQGNSIKRKPTNAVQAVESGIPVLRKNVPVKK